jgi:hypothetical protein
VTTAGEPWPPTEVLSVHSHAQALGLRAGVNGLLTLSQTEERSMTSSHANRVRLSIEALEHRDAAAALTISPPHWSDSEPLPAIEIAASATPGLTTAAVHSGGVVQWSLGGASAAAPSQDRPFHAEDSGTAVVNGDFSIGTTITASASGYATHLGAFTLNDSSTVVGAEGPIRYIEGEAHLIAANGDHLCASFTGSVNLATLTATANFEWTGGTGRFANATGATVWQISLNPDLSYSAVADGVINC